MPQTRTYQVYKFDELTPEQQAKALDNLRNINVDFDDWHEFILDEAKEDLAKQGYADAHIAYSGFWSQGDGASFTATLDIATWLKQHKLAGKYRTLYNHADDCYMRINQSGHYCHEYTMSVDYGNEAYGIDQDTYNRLFDQLDTVSDVVLEDARAEAKRIYRQLEAEYDYQTEDSQVKETILANEYEFTQEGKIA